jgi:hypothetical protein
MFLDNPVLWLSVVGLGLFIFLMFGMIVENTECVIFGTIILLIGLIMLAGSCISLLEPSQEWQVYSDERNESCNECLQNHGWGVTAGDYPNMSPYMYDQCPDCRMCFFP